MKKNNVFILTFLGSGIVLFLIFYLYPARIFDVKLVGSVAENVEVVSLRSFLGMDSDFDASLESSGIIMKRMLSGWMILFIMMIGLPAMIAYRAAFSRKPENNTSKNEDNHSD